MEDLRFPIGKFDGTKGPNTPEERKKQVDTIAEASGAPEAGADGTERKATGYALSRGRVDGKASDPSPCGQPYERLCPIQTGIDGR